MSGNRDESERKPDNPESDTEGATGDSGSPTASPRDKKTRLQTTQGETSLPVTPGRTLGAQNLLVAGRATVILLKYALNYVAGLSFATCHSM